MSAPERKGSGPELGEGLRRAADAATPRPIDVDAVLAASRGTRRARRTAVLGVTATAAVLLAAGGIAIAVNQLGPNAASDSVLTAESGAESVPEASSPDAGGDEASGMRLAAPERVNLCGTPVAAATDASRSGLVVAVQPPAGLAPGATAVARVTVTNAGPSAVVGRMRLAPALTVAGDGIARWHTNGMVSDEYRAVNLEPGASVELEGPVTAASCSEADELGEAFADDLPMLTPGEYGVSAIVVFVDEPTGAIEYLISPLSPVTVG
jgi:hypothetical protein